MNARLYSACKAHTKPLLGRALASLSPPPALSHRHDIFWWNSKITSSFRRGDVDGARRCFEEMPFKNTVTLNCMISGYARNHNIAMAKKLFDEMPKRDVVSWGALLNGYVRCGRLGEARELFDRMPERNAVCWNSMISGYLDDGRIECARELFDVTPTKSSVSWAIMIMAYLRHNLVDEARALFDQAPMLGSSQYNALLSTYVDLGRHSDAVDLFGKMRHRDVVSWNTMITCYSRAGKMEHAKHLFEEMPVKDAVSWTTMIRGYLVNGEIKAASMLFNEMEVRDVVTWNTMIGGYVQNGMLEDALRLFKEMPTQDIVSWNSVLQGYVQSDDMANACLWFDQMPQKDETSWNTLISGYRNEEALVQFRKMTREGFQPDQGTFTVVISVCASLTVLVWGRIMHLYALRLGYEHDTLISSSLITMYSKCGLIADASQVFGYMIKLDTIAWNAMIVARAYHGFSTEAIELLNTMVRAGFKPDRVTFLGILSACAHGGSVDKGLAYFESMLKEWKMVPKPEHYACVVDLLGRAGSIHGAFRFIKNVPLELQANTWETLLSACRVHGNLELAELAAKKVLDSQPLNDGMYVILSNIYAAKGMWEDAASVRGRMKKLGVKKEAASSWIEVKGKMASFGYNDKSHPHAEEIYMALDNLSSIMEGIT